VLPPDRGIASPFAQADNFQQDFDVVWAHPIIDFHPINYSFLFAIRESRTENKYLSI
jgi:hypothetical protein